MDEECGKERAKNIRDGKEESKNVCELIPNF